MTKSVSLERFLVAQSGVYDTALAEIKGARKRTHWIWFIFPQLKGLGMSTTSELYGITSLEETRDYMKHPVLGPRLVECVSTLLALDGHSADDIFGYPDVLKVRSSMTLFSLVEGADPVFAKVLDKFYAGERDKRTLELLYGGQ